MTHNEFLKKIQDLIKEWKDFRYTDEHYHFHRGSGQEEAYHLCSAALKYYFDEYLISNGMKERE